MKKERVSKVEEKDTSTAESSNSFESGALGLSSSVLSARDQFQEGTPISAVALARGILQNHSEYADGKVTALKLEETGSERMASEWLEEVQALFDPSRMRELSKSKEPPVLHGRLAIVGLSLLEPKLRSQLEPDGIFDALVKEIEEPIEKILTKRGRGLYYHPSDSVPNQSDEPLQDIDEDMLGRAAFARFLVRRITTTDVNEGAYSIHLCGPWGSGKTTVLNFLKSELEKSTIDESENQDEHQTSEKVKGRKNETVKKWTIIDFNAWRNQHITPPWWPLYAKIFRKSKKYLGLGYRLQEYSWRLFAGQPFYLLILILVFWLMVVVFSLLGTNSNAKAWADTAKNLSGILALITTVAGAAVGFTRSLLFSSAKAARSFQEYAHDPMQTIQKRFGKLVDKLNKKSRLVIFIDDLDRCNSHYVVGLLEGIQTLFRQGSVFFIVAADNKWLRTCFEEVYKEFKNSVSEPGKSLGALFTEKTFQLCAAVPGIHKDFKSAYWSQLIKVEGSAIKQKINNARKNALEILKDGPSDGEVNKVVEDSKSKPIHEQLAIREEAVVHLASPEVVARTEHTLKPFLPLLDNNPRAMKRLVNAYSVNRARAILSFHDIKIDDLVQWTIIIMRWPQLAEYLIKNPGTIDKVGQNDISDIDEEVSYLFNDEDVKSVVDGGNITGRLNKATVEACSNLG